MDGFSRDMVGATTPAGPACPGARHASDALLLTARVLHAQLRLGTLTGFQYFSCYLRGRQELLVTINREAPTVDGHPSRSCREVECERVQQCWRWSATLDQRGRRAAARGEPMREHERGRVVGLRALI